MAKNEDLIVSSLVLPSKLAERKVWQSRDSGMRFGAWDELKCCTLPENALAL